MACPPCPVDSRLRGNDGEGRRNDVGGVVLHARVGLHGWVMDGYGWSGVADYRCEALSLDTSAYITAGDRHYFR